MDCAELPNTLTNIKENTAMYQSLKTVGRFDHLHRAFDSLL